MRIRDMAAVLLSGNCAVAFLALMAPCAIGQSDNVTLQSLVARSNAMVADGQADLPAYHVHYEIRAWDHRRRSSVSTYDIYRQNPAKVLRLSERGSFSESRLTLGGDVWVKRSGITPLRLTELANAFPRPVNAYDLARKTGTRSTITYRDHKGEPLVCATTENDVELCFDEKNGKISSAQIRDQTIRYGDWIPLGNRFVPGSIEMRLGDRLLFAAQGSVDLLPMAASLFVAQPGAWQMGGPTSTVRDGSADAAPRSEQIDATAADPLLKKRPSGTVFVRMAPRCPPAQMPNQAGFAQVVVDVDQRGRVRKANIEDSDSEEIAAAALKNAKQCTYEPYINDGHPAAFQSLRVYATPFLQPR